tara:strand:+ start:1742 stop:2266 length:525 start_codon:yes stop_codon:yes gene_type:complete
MRIISLLLVLITFNLSSQEIKRVDSEKSFINYTGKHFLHKWSAENKNISGLIQIDGESISNIGIVAKVQDFKSGNSSLDSNSYRVLDALRIPNIVFRSTEIVDSLDLINVSGNISFHGIEKDLNVLLNKSTQNDNISLSGKFIVNLSDFNVERPSLLLQKINNEIEVQINLIFN